ncbi:MAG: GNAT family N-acetyltransferase [Phascolarctobacterium sp.]|nr:GNAT family N-acetyltransferase [Phascolarctobacterium sp.]
MIFRVVNEERMEQVRDLWKYSFEKEDDPFFQWYFSEYCGKDNTVIGGFDENDSLQNMLHLNPYMLRIRGYEQLVHYIVGVATAPESRGRRIFGELLKTAFEVLRSQQFPFVLLMPIHAGIYLPYQFSYCYYRHKYDMDIKIFQPGKTGEDLPVRRETADKVKLSAIYERTVKNWNGVPVRTDFQWKKLLTVHGMENVLCAVCYRDTEAAGYMLYKVADGVFNIIELLSCDQEVRNRLLQYAAQHKSESTRLTWLAEEWDKSYLYFKDQNLSGELYPFMMARCIDARLALSKLPVPDNIPEDSIVLLLSDNIIERNNHLLKLKTSAGKLDVVSTMDDEEITMDMGAFTQLYFGTFSASELYEAGMIRTGNMEKLALLDKIFPKCRNYINEYF